MARQIADTVEITERKIPRWPLKPWKENAFKWPKSIALHENRSPKRLGKHCSKFISTSFKFLNLTLQAEVRPVTSSSKRLPVILTQDPEFRFVELTTVEQSAMMWTWRVSIQVAASE